MNAPPTTPAQPSPARLSRTASRSGPRTLALIVFVLLALGLGLAFGRRVHFDGHAFLHELRALSFTHLLLALLTIYACYWIRALRWAVLLGRAARVRASRLLPSQLIGFTAVALFGRVADLGRPYLIARRLGTAVATQLGVYSVERTLDLAAAAAVFSVTLAFSPANAPHHTAYARAGLLSLVATGCFAAFVLSLGIAGKPIAKWIATRVRSFSPRLGEATEGRLLEFQAGLRSGATARDLLLASVLSLLMWLGIALTYLFTAHAFVTCAPLAALSMPQTVLLMAAGIGGSLLQLPVIGWFTQTALLSAALHELFAVPLGPATVAGALIFLLANLSVIPGGLLAARLTGTQLRESTRREST